MKPCLLDPDDEEADALHRESVFIVLVLCLLLLSAAVFGVLAFQMGWMERVEIPVRQTNEGTSCAF